jgi:hypothetical protein
MKSRPCKWDFHRCAGDIPWPSFGDMSRHLLRVGAVAGVLGAGAQLVAGWIETDWGGPPSEAVARVASNSYFTSDRLLDMIDLFLTLLMLAVVASTLRRSDTHGWAAVSEPLLAFWGAVGAAAILVGAAMKDAAMGGWRARRERGRPIWRPSISRPA